VLAQHADAFAKAFVHLGYTSLGEPGVVRCDLFAVEAPATTGTDGRSAPYTAFLARKVFKTSADAKAHVETQHYIDWAVRVKPLLGGSGLAVARHELDTVFPGTSPFPFRSRWRTV
jgi:quinol monooxygenase YgiN